jgi:hypothetical protein
MLGRAAYHEPWLLADVDRRLFGAANPVESRKQAVAAWLPYVEAQLARGVPLNAMTRHVLGLFNGLPGARAFRRHLSENAHRPAPASRCWRAPSSMSPSAPSPKPPDCGDCGNCGRRLWHDLRGQRNYRNPGGGNAMDFPRHYNAAGDFIDRNVDAGLADKPAFIDPTRTLTYGELARATRQMGNVLAGLDVGREARIALLMHDTVDWPVAFWGAIGPASCRSPSTRCWHRAI